MLGGMAGGGMGFIFAPQRKLDAQDWLQETMMSNKRDMEQALPFAIDPVVYDFSINEQGSVSQRLEGSNALMPMAYYAMMVPDWLRCDLHELPRQTRSELSAIGDKLGGASQRDAVGPFLASILPRPVGDESDGRSLEEYLADFGFDRILHNQVRGDLVSGRLGLTHNRLAATTVIQDVVPADVVDVCQTPASKTVAIGEQAIRNGEVAVLTLAAGVGSRWTEGAGVVKGLHPFCQFGGRHRTFLEVHLAKSRRTNHRFGCELPHIVTTGYLTHQPTARSLNQQDNYRYTGPLLLSEGRAVGLRTIPMVRDLQFAWEELPQQTLDERQQKMRASLRAALVDWARTSVEGSDYRDNLPLQCLHPVGHWYEIPNLLRNGTLRRLLNDRPRLRYLMMHNIDTLGADVDPGILGEHISRGNTLSFEVIHRRLEDRGGGLANVNGTVRLLEGLALPDERDEFKLSYYNSATNWIDIAKLLDVFGLDVNDLHDEQRVDGAVRQLSQRLPTYVTIKDVKKRWGHGQEDVYPVTQFEKLWGDMTALPDVNCGFLVVSRNRGQQLKEQAQLDGWLRDGSADYVESICQWS